MKSATATIDRHRRLRLVERLNRRYQTVTQPIRLGSIQLSFTRIADPDRVLDETIAQVDRLEKLTGRRDPDPPLPYWAQLWDSAAGVAAFLQSVPLRAGTRVLDLGCGMGLAGAAAAAAGASVLLADLESPPLLLAAINTLEFSTRTRTRRLDWRKDHLEERFDLILGSDILYDRSQWEFLDRFFKQHLAEDGCVILGEPGRQTGEMFVPWIGQRGWMFDESSQSVESRDKPIRIFQLRLAKSARQSSEVGRPIGQGV